MLHVSYLLPQHLMDDSLSFIHAPRECSHHANYIIFVLGNCLEPKLVEVSQTETV